MILSTHFITSASVASYTESPSILITGALALHFLLDMIPHREYLDDPRDLKKKLPQLFIDMATGPIVIFLVISSLYGFDLGKLFWFFLGGLFGVIPDGLTFLYLFLTKNKALKSFYAFHNYIQKMVFRDKIISWRNGFIFQILLDFFAVILIILSKA